MKPASLAKIMAYNDLVPVPSTVTEKEKKERRRKVEAIFAEMREMFPERGRIILKIMDELGERTFIATIGGRRYSKHNRFHDVLLKDIRVFGLPLQIEDHLWMAHTKQWERIEPFFQGHKVVLHGVTRLYQRKDGTEDWELDCDRIIKL